MGCISVTANVAPRLCAEMHEAWREGRVDEAMAIQDRLVPLHDALFCETSPGAGEVCAPACWARAPEHCRLPLAPIARGHAGAGARGDGRRRAAELTADHRETEPWLARGSVNGLSGATMAAMQKRRKEGLISHGIAAQNRKARFDYTIERDRSRPGSCW